MNINNDNDTTEAPSLHRDGLPFLVAAHGWCAAAGAAGAYFPDALATLIAEAERGFTPRDPAAGEPRFRLADALRDLSAPDWAAWLSVAIPAADAAAVARHELGEALWSHQSSWRGPLPDSPSWGPRDGTYHHRKVWAGRERPEPGNPWVLRWSTSHEVLLRPSPEGEGWTLTIWAPCSPSYRTEAAEAAMRAAEERLGLTLKE